MHLSWIILTLGTIAVFCMDTIVADVTGIGSADSVVVERLKRELAGQREKRKSDKHRPRPPGGGGRPPYGGGGRPPYGGGGRPPFGGGLGRPPFGGGRPPYYG